MKLGVASSIYVNYPMEEAIRRVADAGYAGIDIWGGRPHVYRQDMSDTELRDLRQLLVNCQLVVPTFMPAFYRYPHSLSSPNKIIRDDSLSYMQQCADNAIALGAQALLIVPGSSLSGQTRQDAWKRMCEGIVRIREYTESLGIRLGIEPVNRYVSDLVNTAEDAMRVIREVGHDGIGVVLDTGHIYLSEETPEQAIANCESHLLEVHVNDNDGQHQQNLVPGDGTFDFDNFLKSLRSTGYSGFLTAELGWEYTQKPDLAVQETHDRLVGLMC